MVATSEDGHIMDIKATITAIWQGSISIDMSPTMTLKVPKPFSGSKLELVVKSHVITPPKTDQKVPDDQLAPSAAFADYELLNILGEGGMAIIYAARQTSMDRCVAIKMIRPKYSRNEDGRNQFLSEAAVTGDLDHPNIVPVYDLGTNEEGVLFYAMKRVKGREWSELIRSQSLGDNLNVLLRVADAVAFAHSRGVIHRDLKPSNIMLGDFGEVMVMDWGLAVSIKTVSGVSSKAEPLGQRVVIGGTPSYMAPEMALGDMNRIGPASDIYLLGAILYELITGHPPHGADDVMECLQQAAQNQIQPAEKKGELLDIALKAMATQPEDRFSGVIEFQAAVRQYQQHAESITLAERATETLAKAVASRDYNEFSRAMFAFEDACALWEQNLSAREGMTRARMVYATCAFEKGDLDLAQSILADGDLSQSPLANKVRQLRQERLLHGRKLIILKRMAAGLTAGLLIVLLTAFVWIRFERDRALVERDRAIHENYCNTIALAEKRIEEGVFGRASELLRETPTRLRHWEWGHLLYRCPPTLPSFRHGDNIPSVAFSPNGQYILTGSLDKTAKLWDASSGKELRVFKGHNGQVMSVAFSPDGKRILTASGDRTAILWNAETGEKLRVLKGHSDGLMCVSFSPDGRRALTGSLDKTAKIWDLESDKEPVTLKGHNRTIWSARFSPDGKRIVTSSVDTTVRLWDAETGREILVLNKHTQIVRAATFSHDGKWILTGSCDRTAKVWNAETGEEVLTLKGHHTTIPALAFSADDRLIITACWDSTIKVWDSRTGLELAAMKGATKGLNAAALSPDGRLILTGSADGVARLYSLEKQDEYRVMGVTLDEDTLAVASSRDEKRILTGGLNNSAKLWNAETGRELLVLKGHAPHINEWIYSVAFSPDERRLLTGSSDGTARVWDSITGATQLILTGHTDRVVSVAFSPDGKKILTGSWDATARLWDSKTGQVLHVFKGHNKQLTSVAFSPDGHKVITGSCDNTAKVWNTNTGMNERTLKGHSHWIYAVAYSPDGQFVLTGSGDSTVRLWDVNTGKTLQILKGHAMGVKTVAFSPDGRRLLTGGGDSTIKLWDSETVRELLTLKGHSNEIIKAAFSSDGCNILSACRDDTRILLWPAVEWKTAGH